MNVDHFFTLIGIENGVATYRVAPGLHPRWVMLWACGRITGDVREARIVDADGAFVAGAR